MDGLIYILVGGIVAILAGVLGYLLTERATPYVERDDDLDEADSASKKKRRKNVDRKKKPASTTPVPEETKSASSASTTSTSSSSRNESHKTSRGSSEETTSTKPQSAAATPKKPVEKEPQPTKPVAKPAVEKQTKPVEKAPQPKGTAGNVGNSTDGGVATRLSPHTSAEKSNGGPKSQPQNVAAAAKSPSPKAEVQRSPQAQSKPKGAQASQSGQQKPKNKKKDSVTAIREQFDDMDLSQTQCLDLVEILKERAEQLGSWTTKGAKSPAESISTLKTRVEQLVEELETTRQAHSQHLHQVSARRVELQEENRRLRLQTTEIQTLLTKKDVEVKQYISRVHKLEDDLKDAAGTTGENDSSNYSLAEENTHLKLELSHVRSQVEQAKKASAATNGSRPSNDGDKQRITELEGTLKEEKEAARKASAEIQQKLKIAESARVKLEERVADLQKSLASQSTDADNDTTTELRRECEQLRSDAEHSSTVLGETSELLGNLQHRIGELQENHRVEIDEKTAAADKAAEELKKAVSETNDLKKQLADAREELQKANTCSDELRKEATELQEEKTKLAHQVTSLEEQNFTLRRTTAEDDSSEV